MKLPDALKLIDIEDFVLNEWSGMSTIARGDYRKWEVPNGHQEICVNLVHHKEYGYIAWAWSFHFVYEDFHTMKRRSTQSFMVYVQDAMKRKGIGSKLIEWGMEMAEKTNLSFLCYPWSTESQLFFDSQNLPENSEGMWG